MTQDGTLHRSDDGLRWTPAGSGPGSEPRALLAAGSRSFVVTNSGIHQSADAGKTRKVLYGAEH